MGFNIGDYVMHRKFTGIIRDIKRSPTNGELFYYVRRDDVGDIIKVLGRDPSLLLVMSKNDAIDAINASDLHNRMGYTSTPTSWPTSEEIASAQKAWMDAFKSSAFDYNNKGGCNHDLKEYYGFTESYKYCTKCDHKERL